jgi:hypothetical protein
MGEGWTPLLALAFDLGCDLVMTDWEAEIAQQIAGEPDVQTKALSPEEAWALL